MMDTAEEEQEACSKPEEAKVPRKINGLAQGSPNCVGAPVGGIFAWWKEKAMGSECGILEEAVRD
jgi:hypothetical protein